MRKIFFIGTVTIVSIMLFVTGCSKDYTPFAQCLTDKNVKMYGAFWCPHCSNQKEMFGNAFEKVTYIECSLPDKSGQTEVCKTAGIASYPTWEFADGSRIQGEMTLEALVVKTGCVMG